MESPTQCKKSVDAVGEVFIQIARQHQWTVEISEQEKAGNAICITMNPESEEKPIAFSGHIDTVYPHGVFSVPAVHRDEERIYGPGVIDCKGGVVAAVMTMEALMRCGFRKRPIKLIIQTDEETGNITSDKKPLPLCWKKQKMLLLF